MVVVVILLTVDSKIPKHSPTITQMTPQFNPGHVYCTTKQKKKRKKKEVNLNNWVNDKNLEISHYVIFFQCYVQYHASEQMPVTCHFV